MKKLLVPQKFDAEMLLENYDQSDFPLKIKPFHLNFIMDSVLMQIQKQAINENSKKINGVVPISTAILNNVMGKYYKYALSFLVEKEIIICKSTQFIKWEKCRFYTLNKSYLECDVKTVLLSSKEWWKIQNSYTKTEQQKLINRLDKQRSYLFKIFESGDLKFDKSSFEIIDSMKDEELLEILQNEDDDDDKYEETIIKWREQKKLISSFNQGYYGNIHSDSFGRRFHSPITRVNSDIRKLLTYKGQRLIEIDIKNCQPFLFLSFLNESFWFNNQSQLKQSKDTYQNNQFSLPFFDKELASFLTEVYSYLYSSITLVKSPEMLTGIEFEPNSFFADVKEGIIYEEIMKALKISWDNEQEFKEQRKKIKKEVIKFINSHPTGDDNKSIEEIKYHKRIRIVFEKKYNIIVQLLDAIKSFKTNERVLYFPKYIKYENDAGEIVEREENMYVDSGYKKVASTLQRMESYLVLDVVCKELLKRYPEIPLLTVHDCIMTTHEFANIVETYIKNIFEKHVGFAPKITVE